VELWLSFSLATFIFLSLETKKETREKKKRQKEP